MACVNQLSQDNIALLMQLKALLTSLSAQQYRQHNELLDSGSIGAHTRHIIEHYTSFLSSPQHVNYDDRERKQILELNVDVTLAAFGSLCSQLQKLDADQSCDVICATNIHSGDMPVTSSLTRELTFLYSHTTHHMAIIRILALSQSIDVPAGFGKAASTQRFEQVLEQASV